MLVDSSGSRKPPASPSATTLPTHARLRWPARKRSGLGSAERRAVQIGEQGRGRLVVRDSARSNRHSRCRCGAGAGCAIASPAARAVARVIGRRSPLLSHGTAIARSHGSQCDQSSNPAPSVSSISRPRKPEQSMNRSPATRAPDCRTTAATWPVSPSRSTSTIRPSVPLHAPAFGEAAQVARVQPGIELEGVADLGQRRVGQVGARVREAPALAGDDAQRIIARAAWRSPSVRALEPVMVELDPLHVDAVEAERVDVALADARPVDELDAELVGGVGRADEIGLVDAEQRVEQHDLRDGRFADADGADLVRFDQFDRQRPAALPSTRAIAAAAIQPAVPPPTMTMRRTASRLIRASPVDGERRIRL